MPCHRPNRPAAIAVALVLGLTAPAIRRAGAAPTFTDELWSANRDVYMAILAHPFLQELQRGTLDRDAFAFYMMQDVSYLRAFGQALGVIAAKAPRPEWRTLLEQHARDSVAAELQLHESVFKDYGIARERVAGFEPAPEAFAYETFMLATAHAQPFGEALSALLPCYWIYLEVGKTLERAGSRDATYQRWIDNYSSAGYERTVQAVLAIINEVAASAPADSRARMHANFRRAARYEWMFWDSAYHKRRWQP
jgi:thiaminase/transcriptional activator TenA